MSFLLCGCILTGCIPPKFINHPAPEMKVDFTPFGDAGCPLDNNGYYHRCEEGSVLYNLGCDQLAEVPDEFGGLSPVYPMVVCTYVPYWRDDVADPANTPESEYFYNDGGLLPLLVRYVIYKDGEFQLIKNPDEFQAIFAPVDSPEEALSFALANKRIYAAYGLKYELTYRYEVGSIEDTYVKTTDVGYLVHAFDYQVAGCGPHYYYAVDLNVTLNGQVEEINRTKIYRDPKQDGLCVD